MRRLTWVALAVSGLTFWLDGLLWFSGDRGPVGWLLELAVPQLFVVPSALTALWAFRRRAWAAGAWCGAASLAQVFGPLGLCLGHPSPARADLRVATYNVEKFGATPQAIARMLRSLDLDVICLQEASYWQSLDLPERFRTKMPGYYVYAEAGMAILSKFPMNRTSTRNFPASGVPTGWNVQEAAIQIDGQTVNVLNVHMIPPGYQPDPSLPQFGFLERVAVAFRYREAQTERLRDRAEAKGGPTIVCGDFNQQPFGPRYRRLTRRLTDAFRATSRGFGYSLTSNYPTKRVDYILTRGIRPLRTSVVATRASDHRPVVADLSFSNGAEEGSRG